MFGKPAWFRKKSVGWGLRPVSWRGWLYALTWVGVICLPFAVLLASQRVFESLIWVGAMMGALLWDVRQVILQMDGAGAGDESEILVIDEHTEPPASRLATRSYDLRMRG
jgi:hypothetical protein